LASSASSKCLGIACLLSIEAPSVKS
jgi:hypothetical protein